MIGPLLAAAYDMHTREGLAALRLFAECADSDASRPPIPI
jgi:hypothetical protein